MIDPTNFLNGLPGGYPNLRQILNLTDPGKIVNGSSKPMI